MQATRFPDKVRNYLQEKLDVSNATGHKADPLQFSINMRCTRDELSRRLFATSRCFKHSRSIHFYRSLPQQRKNVQSPADLSEDEVRVLESDTRAGQYEMREGIIAEVTEAPYLL